MENQSQQDRDHDSNMLFGVSKNVFTNIIALLVMIAVIILFVWMPGPADKEAEEINRIDQYRKEKEELDSKELEQENFPTNSNPEIQSEENHLNSQIQKTQLLTDKNPEEYRELIRGLAVKDKIQYKRLAIPANADLIEMVIDSLLHLAMAKSYFLDTNETQKATDQIVLAEHFLERAAQLAHENSKALIDQIREELTFLHSLIEGNKPNLRIPFDKTKSNLEDLLLDTFRIINESCGKKVMPESRNELSTY